MVALLPVMKYLVRQQCDERQNLTDKEVIVLSKKCDGQTSIKGWHHRDPKNSFYLGIVLEYIL